MITIFNPNDIPFGPLSNHYKQSFIDEKGDKWISVSTYIYAKNMKLPLYKSLLINSPPEEASRIFVDYNRAYKDLTIVKSLDTAYRAKITSDPRMKKILQESFNNIFKDDSIRKVLEQIRKEYTQIYDFENELFINYKVSTILENIISRGIDIIKYKNYTIQQLLGLASTFEIPTPSKEDIMTLYSNGLINETMLSLSPRELVNSIRKTNLQVLIDNQEFTNKEKIFNAYTDQFIQKNFPDLIPTLYERAKTQSFANKDVNKLRDMAYRLYQEERLGLIMDVDLIPISNLEDVVEDERVEDERVEDERVDDERVDDSNTTEWSRLFSPFEYTGMFEVRGLLFPTVWHYVLYTLMNDDYKFILKNNRGIKFDDFLDIISLRKKYDIIEEQRILNQVRTNLSAALKLKFRNSYFSTLLQSTQNKQLIWEDPNDTILNQNEVGKQLMYIRKQIPIDKKILKVSTMDFVKDDFISRWITTKFLDIYFLLTCLNRKEITPSYIRRVISVMYSPCEYILESSNPLPIKLDQVKSPFISIDSKKQIYQYITSLLSFIHSNSKDKTIGALRNTLVQAEFILSSRLQNCRQVIESDEFSNCIANALINIIIKLKVLNPSKITLEDVDTAMCILKNEPNDITQVIDNLEFSNPKNFIIPKDDFEEIIELDEYIEYKDSLPDTLEITNRNLASIESLLQMYQLENDNIPKVILKAVSDYKEFRQVLTKKRNRVNFFSE